MAEQSLLIRIGIDPSGAVTGGKIVEGSLGGLDNRLKGLNRNFGQGADFSDKFHTNLDRLGRMPRLNIMSFLVTDLTMTATGMGKVSESAQLMRTGLYAISAPLQALLSPTGFAAVAVAGLILTTVLSGQKVSAKELGTKIEELSKDYDILKFASSELADKTKDKLNVALADVKSKLEDVVSQIETATPRVVKLLEMVTSIQQLGLLKIVGIAPDLGALTKTETDLTKIMGEENKKRFDAYTKLYSDESLLDKTVYTFRQNLLWRDYDEFIKQGVAKVDAEKWLNEQMKNLANKRSEEILKIDTTAEKKRVEGIEKQIREVLHPGKTGIQFQLEGGKKAADDLAKSIMKGNIQIDIANDHLKKQGPIWDELQRRAEQLRNVGIGYFSGLGDAFAQTMIGIQVNWDQMVKAMETRLLSAVFMKILSQILGKSFLTGFGELLSFQHGTPFVPATGVYVLHQGEAVVPANRNVYQSSVFNQQSYGNTIVIQNFSIDPKKLTKDKIAPILKEMVKNRELTL